MAQLSEYLFVYGTLQPGFTNPFAQFLHRNSRYAGCGTMSGRLYEIGPYPGAVHDPASSTYVYGSVFNLGLNPSLLPCLDEYEGVSRPPAGTDEYRRVVVPVNLGNDVRSCWTYLYNRAVLVKPLIRSGSYASQ